jgi:hypothetical protein
MRTVPDGRLLATDCTLKQLIQGAYSLEPWKIVGGPPWLDSDRFDIEARAGKDFSQDHDRVVALGRDAPREMIDILAERLSYWILRRPVLDKTGIQGNFSVKIEIAPDESQPDAAPSLFTAIQDQLGLRLESTRGPVEFLIVDHAEKPSPN